MLSIVSTLGPGWLGFVLATQPQLPAEAPPPLDWRAPPACPTQRDVEASIIELAGRAPEPGEVQVRAQVQQVGASWKLELETHAGSAHDQRLLDAETCDGLAAATALIVAVLLDPVAAASQVPAPSANPLETGTSFVPAVAGAPPGSDTSALERRWNFGLHLGVGGEVGAIPRGTGGGRLELFAQRGLLEIRLAGSYWIPRRTGRDGEPRVQVHLGTAAVTPCIVPAVGRLQIPVCAGVEAGGLRGEGENVLDGGAATVFWVAGAVGPGLRWWVRPRFALSASAEAFVPFVRDRLTLGEGDGARVLHEPAIAGFRALLGVSVGFSGSP